MNRTRTFLFAACLAALSHSSEAQTTSATKFGRVIGTTDAGATVSTGDSFDVCNAAHRAREPGRYFCTKVDEVAVTALPAVNGWTFCANERSTCNFTGSREVLYGESLTGRNVKKTVTGPAACGNPLFGDPAYGVTKKCYLGPVAPVVVPEVPTQGGVPTLEESASFPITGPIVATSGQVIRRQRVRSTTGNCITVPAGVTDVTIEANEIGPCGKADDQNSNGVKVEQGATRVTVRLNNIHHVASGLYADGARHPIVFDKNSVTEIRGPSDRQGTEWPRGQMVQFNGVVDGTAPSRVNCNVSDQRSENHAVEDHINMFNSPGLGDGANRTEIAYNRLIGGHPQSNSGTGIVVGDGASGGNAWVHHNTVVNVRNVGIGVAGGKNVTVEANRIYMHRDATYTNVGLYVWMQGNGASGSCSGHKVLSNRVWVLNSNGTQNPWWNGGNCGAVELDKNVFGDGSLTPAIFNEVPAQCQ